MIKNAKLRKQLQKSTYPNTTNNKNTKKNGSNMSETAYLRKAYRKIRSKSKRSSRQRTKSQTKLNKQKFLSKLYASTFRCMRQYSLKNSFVARNSKSQSKPYICYNQNKKQSGRKFVNNRQLIKNSNLQERGNHTTSHSNVVDRLSFLNKVDLIYNHVIKQKEQKHKQELQNKYCRQYLPSFVQYFLGDAIYVLKRQSISKFQFEKMCLDSYYKAEQDDVKLFMGQHLYLQNDQTQNSRINSNSKQLKSFNSRNSLGNSKKSIKSSQTIKPSQIRKNKLSISNSRQITNSKLSNSRQLKSRRNTFDFGLLQPNSTSFKTNAFSAIQQNAPLILQTFRNTTNCFLNQNNQNKENESKTKNLRESRLWQREKRKYYFQNLEKKQSYKENQNQDLTIQRIQFKLNSYLQKIGNSMDNKSRFLEQNFNKHIEAQQTNKKSRFLML